MSRSRLLSLVRTSFAKCERTKEYKPRPDSVLSGELARRRRLLTAWCQECRPQHSSGSSLSRSWPFLARWLAAHAVVPLFSRRAFHLEALPCAQRLPTSPPSLPTFSP